MWVKLEYTDLEVTVTEAISSLKAAPSHGHKKLGHYGITAPKLPFHNWVIAETSLLQG